VLCEMNQALASCCSHGTAIGITDYELQVRVRNDNQMRVPLRVKAFAAFQDDLTDNAKEWLPPELRPQPQPPALCTAAAAAAAASLELKGPRVSSYVFQSPYVRIRVSQAPCNKCCCV